jgi:hypothetical protein
MFDFDGANIGLVLIVFLLSFYPLRLCALAWGIRIIVPATPRRGPTMRMLSNSELRQISMWGQRDERRGFLCEQAKQINKTYKN